jgi:hypothetical protein
MNRYICCPNVLPVPMVLIGSDMRGARWLAFFIRRFLVFLFLLTRYLFINTLP